MDSISKAGFRCDFNLKFSTNSGGDFVSMYPRRAEIKYFSGNENFIVTLSSIRFLSSDLLRMTAHVGTESGRELSEADDCLSIIENAIVSETGLSGFSFLDVRNVIYRPLENKLPDVA